MYIDDLEELLADILPAGFSIEAGKNGEVVIYTGLRADEDGELTNFDSDDEDDDPSFDEDLEPLEDEDDEDD